MTEAAIEAKYREGRNRDLLGEPAGDVRRAEEGAVNFRLYEHGLIAWREDVGASIVRSDPPFRDIWISERTCAGLGMVTGDAARFGGGPGWSQTFEHGEAFWHAGVYRPRRGGAVYNGPIADLWRELGGPIGALGYPKGRAQPVPADLSGVTVTRQRFARGAIVCYETADGATCIAALDDGTLLPERPYRLTLDSVLCVREADGLGSDEAGISVVTTPSDGASSVQRWFDGDVDSGERHEIGLTLHDGNMPVGLSVSMIGLEKDGRRAFQKQRRHFEEAMETLDLTFDFSTDRWDRISTATRLGASGLGILIGAAVGGITVTASAGVLTIGASAGVGGAIGLAVGILALIGAGIGLRFRPADLLLLDRTVYIGQFLHRMVDGGDLPDESVLEIAEDNMKISVAYERASPNSVVETRRYSRIRDGGPIYELALTHTVG